MLRVLHLHSSFQPGGKELRAAQLMNAFGAGIEHTVVSAEPGQLDAASAIARSVAVDYPTDFPALQRPPQPAAPACAGPRDGQVRPDPDL